MIVIQVRGLSGVRSAPNNTVISPSCNEWHLRIVFIVTRALHPSRDFSVLPLYAICNCTSTSWGRELKSKRKTYLDARLIMFTVWGRRPPRQKTQLLTCKITPWQANSHDKIYTSELTLEARFLLHMYPCWCLILRWDNTHIASLANFPVELFQGTKQFFVAVRKSSGNVITLGDLYDRLINTQAVIFCNTKRKVILVLILLYLKCFRWSGYRYLMSSKILLPCEAICTPLLFKGRS